MTTSETESATSPAAERAQQPEEIAFLRELGQRVRQARAVHGMSRKVLARAAGISERYIAQLESGRGNVSVLLLRRVGGAMGVNIQTLFGTSAETLLSLLRSAPPEIAARARLLLSQSSLEQMRQPRDRVALIGLRGAGKSTLGRMAAERLGWTFVELNAEIERDSGLSVPEVFDLYGQAGYRRLEEAALRRLIGRPGPMIVAAGGGIVAEAVTFDLLLAAFTTIWLRARPEEHMNRVRRQGDLRPMADDPSAMRELRTILASREPLYSRASLSLDTSTLAVDEAAARLVDSIRGLDVSPGAADLPPHWAAGSFP